METAQEVEAVDPKAAAVAFMKQTQAANSIIVSKGWLRETVFANEDIKEACHFPKDTSFPLLQPKRSNSNPRPFWKEYLRRLFTGGSGRH